MIQPGTLDVTWQGSMAFNEELNHPPPVSLFFKPAPPPPGSVSTRHLIIPVKKSGARSPLRRLLRKEMETHSTGRTRKNKLPVTSAISSHLTPATVHDLSKSERFRTGYYSWMTRSPKDAGRKRRLTDLQERNEGQLHRGRIAARIGHLKRNKHRSGRVERQPTGSGNRSAIHR